MYRVNVTNCHAWAERVMGVKITQDQGDFYASVKKKADADFIRLVNQRTAECVTVKKLFGT